MALLRRTKACGCSLRAAAVLSFVYRVLAQYHGYDVAAATENLAEIANQLTNLKATLGRDAPSVIS